MTWNLKWWHISSSMIQLSLKLSKKSGQSNRVCYGWIDIMVFLTTEWTSTPERQRKWFSNRWRATGPINSTLAIWQSTEWHNKRCSEWQSTSHWNGTNTWQTSALCWTNGCIPCFIKLGPLCILAITFSNVDRFEWKLDVVFHRKFAFRGCGLQLHIVNILCIV